MHALLVVLLIPIASAQQPPADSEAPPRRESVNSSEASAKAAKGVNLRYHYSIVPNFILDVWWYPTEESTGVRPKIESHTFGIEYTIDPRPSSFQIFADFFYTPMDDGYFDDVDDSVISHTDGDWVEPHNIAMVVVGGHFGHEVALTDENADSWIGLEFGAGLAIGPGLGRFDRWLPGVGDNPNGCQVNVPPSQVRWKVCEPDKVTRLPPLMGVVDLGTQLRFHFADRALLRLDLMMRPIPTIGVAAGGAW